MSYDPYGQREPDPQHQPDPYSPAPPPSSPPPAAPGYGEQPPGQTYQGGQTYQSGQYQSSQPYPPPGSPAEPGQSYQPGPYQSSQPYPPPGSPTEPGQSYQPGPYQSSQPYQQPTSPYPTSPYQTGPYQAGQPDPYGAQVGWAPPPRRRRTGLVLGLVAGGLALVLCLGVAGLVAIRALDDNPGDTPSGPLGGDDPFAGTPAADFAVGADGIEPPEPEAVGEFSASEVADMLTQVEAAMIASRLDSRMLVDRDPDAFLQLLSENNEPYIRDFFDEDTFAEFASQLADGAELAEPEPRVSGTMTFQATRDDGGIRVIQVDTSFVWAYALVPGEDQDLDGIVVVRDQLVWHVAHPDDVPSSSLGLWLWEFESSAWGIDCDAYDDGLLAPQTVGDSGVDDQLYDPESALSAGTC